MLAGLTQAKHRKSNVTLRDFQDEYVDGVDAEWAEGRNKILVVAPTGAGKTTLMGAIIAKEVDKGGRVLVVTDRKKLTKQFARRTEQDFGIPCGIEMATIKHSGEDVICCTDKTIVNRIAQGKFHPEQFTLLAFDEAHLSLADGFQKVAKHFDKARLVGLTATPRRGDKKDLLKFYDSMVEKRTLAQLIDGGYLAPLTIRNIPISIRIQHEGKGDFDDEEVNHAIEPYLESCADVMVEEGRGRCCLTFLPLIVTSQKFAKLLNERGMRTEHVDGTMEERDIEEAIARLELGQIDCLSCSQLLGVGVDIKPVSLICNLSPTRSWTSFVQKCGRGTRTFDPRKPGDFGDLSRPRYRQCSWPQKSDCVLLDPLWLTSDHNLLMRPSVLVAQDENEQEEIDKALKKGGGGSLMGARASATEEREAKLRQRLDAMRKKKARTIDAMELFSRTGHMELIGYEPLARWESEKPSPKQLEFLIKQKVDIGPDMTRGMASKMIDVFMDRIRKGLATGGQVKFAIGLGMDEDAAWKMSFDEAKKYLDANAPSRPSWQRR